MGNTAEDQGLPDQGLVIMNLDSTDKGRNEDICANRVKNFLWWKVEVSLVVDGELGKTKRRMLGKELQWLQEGNNSVSLFMLIWF